MGPLEFVHKTAPLAVEIYGYKVPISIEHWRTRIAPDGVRRVANAHGRARDVRLVSAQVGEALRAVSRSICADSLDPPEL